MAWDGRGYYYRSRRVGGRVARDYYGKGPIAEAAAHLVERACRAQAAAGGESARRGAADGAFRDLAGRLDLAAAAELRAAGYRRHDRGPWRKARGVGPDEAGALGVPARRPEAGQPEVPTELRDTPPTRAEWATLESLARAAREAWADAASGGDPADRAVRMADLGRAATRLAGRGAGPLVRLLATRAALADARLSGERACVVAAGVGGRSAAAAGRVRRAERDAAAAARSLEAARQRLGGGVQHDRPAPRDGTAVPAQDRVRTGRAT